MDAPSMTCSRHDASLSVPSGSQHSAMEDEPTFPARPLPTIVPLSKSSTIATLNDPPSQKLERMNIRLASAFVIFFVFGWGDGVTGTLLPYFKDDFHLSFMASSLCFVTSTVGFGLGTAVVERILGLAGWICILPHSKRSVLRAIFGRYVEGHICGHSPSQARFVVSWAGTLLHPVFFVIMGCRINFASILVAYSVSAFSRSILTANMNHYVASTPKKALGYMYGFWSIGSMCAPLVCQSVIATGIPWNRFYFGSLVLSGISSAFAFYAFRPSLAELERDILHGQIKRSADTLPADVSVQHQEPKTPPTPDSEKTVAFPEPHMEASAPSHYLLRALTVPLLWAIVIYLGIYTGVEAGTQGFVVTYLLAIRNANEKTVGYSTSGFWGGQALSRFLWGYFNTQMTATQRKWTVQLCIALALILQFTLWFVNSFIENCFATALLGLVYGPLFVAGLALVNELLPVDLHMIAMQICSSSGSFGAALFPFIIGTVMSYKGSMTLVYILVSQTVALTVIWFLLPNKSHS